MASALTTRISPAVLKSLSAEVYKHTGVMLVGSKQNMLISRLRRRIKANGLSSFEDYLDLIVKAKAGSTELEAFIDVVTTHKTTLFRTPRIWRFLWETYLPAFAAEPLSSPLKFWSAACSTGQEAASMAVLAENYISKYKKGSYSILASDVSKGTVEIAREQTFERSRLRKDKAMVPFLETDRYFDMDKEFVTLKKAQSSRIRFQQHNLFNPMRTGRFNLIFVRNVLIYFTDEDKMKVVQNCTRVLDRGGLLIIGESESLMGDTPGLKFKVAGVYERV